LPGKAFARRRALPGRALPGRAVRAMLRKKGPNLKIGSRLSLVFELSLKILSPHQFLQFQFFCEYVLIFFKYSSNIAVSQNFSCPGTV
jgi:hypothetical protein